MQKPQLKIPQTPCCASALSLLALFSLCTFPFRVVVRRINQLLELLHQVAQPAAHLFSLWHWQKRKICPLKKSKLPDTTLLL